MCVYENNACEDEEMLSAIVAKGLRKASYAVDTVLMVKRL